MKKILVIEDEAIILLGILNLLQRNGYEAIGAKNGYLGIRLAIEHIPDLILCNVIMPHLSGYQVFQELRNNLTTSTIPFLFLTAQNLDAEWFDNYGLGGVQYLTKPYNPQELLNIIRKLL